MSPEPTIVERADQPYASITGRVTMQTVGKIADRFPELFGFLAARGIEPTGAPIFKYNRIDMDGELEIEAAVPVAAVAEGDNLVTFGILPAGRYATVTHVGHPDQLRDATRDLLAWAQARGLEWDVDGDRWVCRMEIYNTDPEVEPDMNKWDTDLVFKLL
jgi:effector-binding domain-containing protein